MFMLKWLLFVFAIFFSVVSIDPIGSMGGTAAGMWVAFALLHVQDRREALDQKAKNEKARRLE